MGRIHYSIKFQENILVGIKESFGYIRGTPPPLVYFHQLWAV